MNQPLAALGERYFAAKNAAQPLTASVMGIPGHDTEMPDPSRESDAAYAARLAGFETELSTVDTEALSEEDKVTHAMLGTMLRNERATLDAGIAEVSISGGFFGRVSGLVSMVPRVSVASPGAAEAYLTRLGRIGDYFDAASERGRQATADGRLPFGMGVSQAIEQAEDYLAGPVGTDPLLKPEPGGDVDTAAWRARAAELVEKVVRPAVARYRDVLRDEILPAARPADKPGVCHVPGGDEGYAAAVRTHTTTDLSPEQLHRIGLDLVASLREEFAERGEKVLGVTGADAVLHRLRTDESMHFESGEQIIETVTAALRRAEAAVPDWFAAYPLTPCEVQEMQPLEAAGGVLGYYMRPSADGGRKGATAINTFRPELWARYECEVLAFHETVPGHHLQFGVVVPSLAGRLPEFRRFARVNAHSEGWGLYTERLADEMGLYTDDLSRIGMVSFDAFRACRLVVDTGMHALGWTRQQAIDYMVANTATSERDIVNEVDRYIADPGQALAYMVGRLRIQELRERAETRLGAAFDIKAFHGHVLDNGVVPLDILEGIIDRWTEGAAR